MVSVTVGRTFVVKCHDYCIHDENWDTGAGGNVDVDGDSDDGKRDDNNSNTDLKTRTG